MEWSADRIQSAANEDQPTEKTVRAEGCRAGAHFLRRHCQCQVKGGDAQTADHSLKHEGVVSKNRLPVRNTAQLPQTRAHGLRDGEMVTWRPQHYYLDWKERPAQLSRWQDGTQQTLNQVKQKNGTHNYHSQTPARKSPVSSGKLMPLLSIKKFL